jgi:hypothetical protein
MIFSSGLFVILMFYAFLCFIHQEGAVYAAKTRNSKNTHWPPQVLLASNRLKGPELGPMGVENNMS